MAIATTCPSCQKTYNLNDNLAGKRVKCPCGAAMSVGAAVTAPAAASRVAASTASRGGTAVATAPPALAASQRSIFDELTENDFNRSPYTAPTAAAATDMRSEAKVLKRFAGEDPAAAQEAAESKSWFIFLGVVHIIWAVIYCAAAVLFIVASAALAMVEDSMPILRLGMAAVVAVASIFAVWTAATGIGLLMYKPWGWWLGVYSLFWGIFDRISALTLSLMDAADDGSYSTGQYIGMGLGILGCIGFLQLFASEQNRRAFKVRMPTAPAFVICAFAALLVTGGITLVIYMTTGSVEEELALHFLNSVTIGDSLG